MDEQKQKPQTLIGRAEKVRFPDLADAAVFARIDSGARTSAIWGKANINAEGQLEVTFFDNPDLRHTFTDFGHLVVATSTGHVEKRYTVRLLVVVKGRKVRAVFTIANRSTQVYPVLIGRNVLRGKFIIDVKLGKTLKALEKKRVAALQETLDKEVGA